MATVKKSRVPKAVGRLKAGPAAKKTVVKKRTPRKPVVRKKAASSIKLPAVGRSAPAFSLLNQEGHKISLKDYLGKQHVVLYFYPRAMTPGCTVQACGIRDSSAEFKKLRAVVLGVSPDKVASLAKFHQRDKLNFDLLSDEDHAVASRYGVWALKKFMGREFMGVRRWTFIIGKDGKIQHIMDDVNTKTHHKDVLEIIATLK